MGPLFLAARSGLKMRPAQSRSKCHGTSINRIKRLLSHTIAEWACGLKYEDLSPEAIQAAKLFWFDSIGCACSRKIYIACEA
jgi:hypothetical protein